MDTNLKPTNQIKNPTQFKLSLSLSLSLQNAISNSLSLTIGSFTLMPGWSQDHPDLQKNCIYIFAKKIKSLFTKLIYCDHPKKIVEHPSLKITIIWVQQK